MNLCEVREWVIDDHVRLKGRLNVIERLTARALSGESESVDSLRFECEMMLADLAQHMRWEDRYLAPVLRVDAKRVERLERDHREQRQLLSYIVARVREPACPAALLARTMAIFADLLREDMRGEETNTLISPASRDSEIRFEAAFGLSASMASPLPKDPYVAAAHS